MLASLHGKVTSCSPCLYWGQYPLRQNISRMSQVNAWSSFSKILTCSSCAPDLATPLNYHLESQKHLEIKKYDFSGCNWRNKIDLLNKCQKEGARFCFHQNQMVIPLLSSLYGIQVA